VGRLDVVSRRANCAVYVAPTDGSTAPLRLTDMGEDTELVGWTHDSRAVIIGHNQAALLNVDTGEELRLPSIAGNLVPLRHLEDDTWVGTLGAC